MVVADTCVWVEWVTGTALGKRFTRVFADADNLIVPTLVLHELYKWCLRELTEEQAETVVAGTRLGRAIPLTEPIALHAAQLARTHRLATADAIVYATADLSNARLITVDRHFKGLSGVEYTPKA
jgi:predicted nucleic acid-binding protein